MRMPLPATMLRILLGGVLLGAAGAQAQDAPPQLADAVHEAMYVRIGAIDQWVQIRGDHRANPVLLWLNGGPGGSTMMRTPAYRSWERWFNVVMWDERGEGRTFEKNGESEAATMSFAQMAADGVELSEFLRRHLHKDRIILLGHSAGSIVGIHMVKSRPDLFAAYVGTGQVTYFSTQMEAAYAPLRARAAPGSDAERELAAIGPPPWKGHEAEDVVNKWGALLDPPPAPPSDADRRTFMSRPRPPAPPYIQAGMEFSNRMLDDDAFAREDLPALGTGFKLPIVFIQGSDDLITTTSVVREYFDRIAAPAKEFVELPGAGHMAIFAQRDAFLSQLLTQVRPFAVKGQSVERLGARHVVGQTLISSDMPAMRLTVPDTFRYAGPQSFVLDDNSHVEQHFFVDADAQKLIRRLYWVQLQGYLPDNALTYGRAVAARTRIGGLDFTADGSVRDAAPDPPDSDGARARIFLASKGYRMESTGALMERLVHPVGRDRRNRLVITYVETGGSGTTTGTPQQGDPARLAGLLARAIGNLTITP